MTSGASFTISGAVLDALDRHPLTIYSYQIRSDLLSPGPHVAISQPSHHRCACSASGASFPCTGGTSRPQSPNGDASPPSPNSPTGHATAWPSADYAALRAAVNIANALYYLTMPTAATPTSLTANQAKHTLPQHSGSPFPFDSGSVPVPHRDGDAVVVPRGREGDADPRHYSEVTAAVAGWTYCVALVVGVLLAALS